MQVDNGNDLSPTIPKTKKANDPGWPLAKKFMLMHSKI